MTKNTKTSLRVQGESWKHQRKLQCHVKERFLKRLYGKPLFQKQNKPRRLKQRLDSVVITEAHESTRQRMESVTKRIHEEHIAGKGPFTHYSLVHKFIPMPQAMKIPDAKATVDKEWNKLETIPAWDVKKVKSKKEVIKEAQKNNNKVHFSFIYGLMSSKEFRVGATIP